jgi:hypothetical protein
MEDSWEELDEDHLPPVAPRLHAEYDPEAPTKLHDAVPSSASRNLDKNRPGEGYRRTGGDGGLALAGMVSDEARLYVAAFHGLTDVVRPPHTAFSLSPSLFLPPASYPRPKP